MPSPFPGMNPYLEQADVWQDFHLEFLTALRRRLAPTIRPDYIVQVEEHVYIHDHDPGPRSLLRRPDISVTRSANAPSGLPGTGIMEAPVLVQIPVQDVERVRFLQIRDRRDREVVTVIELLSLSNKRPGEDRQHYLAKRRKTLWSGAHLVEIDLLRGWPPMPAEGRPMGDYSVLVSRAWRRPVADFWPIRLRDRLPTIPIPLKPTDAEGRVDLQDVLHQAYDGPGYEDFIYEGSPEPRLSAADADWAAQFVLGTA